MKRKITLLTTAVLCVGCIAAGAAANEVIREIKAQLRPDFTVEIDGEVKSFKNAKGETVYPVLYDGTTYLPIRAIGEIMGKTVYWYEDEKRIELNETTVTDADVIITGSDDSDKDKTKDKSDFKKSKDGKKENKEDVDKKAGKNHIAESNEYIGIDAAKEISLKKAALIDSDVQFIKAEIDSDDGVVYYDIEFKCNGVEYEAEISAVDGKILSWETDTDN